MSTQISSDFPYIYNGASSSTSSTDTSYRFSMMPGGHLINETFGSIPIYNSTNNLLKNQINYDNIVDKILCMPGHKMITYDNMNYDTSNTVSTFDNAQSYIQSTNNPTTVNAMTGCKLYYHGVESKTEGGHQTAIEIPCSIVNTLQAPNFVDNDGAYAYYRLDTDYKDYISGSGSENAIYSGVSIDTSTTKLTSGSLRVNSATGSFRVPAHTIDATKGYSVAFWYKLNSMPTANIYSAANSWARIFEAGWGSGQAGSIMLGYPTYNSLQVYFSPASGNPSGVTYDVPIDYTMDYTWHHVCVTCSINGYWTVYIDAVERSMPLQKVAPPTSSLTYWYLGKSIYPSDGHADANFNALYICNRELKPYEVYYLYKNPTQVSIYFLPTQINLSNIAYYYPFNGNKLNYAGSMYPTGTGVDNTTTTGTVSYDTINKMMNYASLKIDSVNGYVNLPAHTLTVSNGYSISFWYKLSTPSTATYARMFEACTALQNVSLGSVLLYYESANSGALFFQTHTPRIYTSVNYTVDTNWHHYCLRLSTSGVWTLYVDGRLKYTSETVPYTSIVFNYFYLGKSSYEWDGNAVSYWNNLCIFNRELMVDELRYLYYYPQNPVNYIPYTTNTVSPYIYLNNYYPCFPGGYLLDHNRCAYPIYTSIQKIGTADTSSGLLNDADNSWWVMPGYKFIIYFDSDFNYDASGAITSTISFTVDNTYGFNMMCKMSERINQATSVRVYYKGQEVWDGSVQATNTPNTTTANNSIPSTIPFLYKVGPGLTTGVSANTSNNYPTFNGVWLINYQGGCIPIYTSIRDLSFISMNDIDDNYIVLPGFKVITYKDTNYGGTSATYDNTDGYNMLYFTTGSSLWNSCSSVKVYFHGIEIKDTSSYLS